MRLHYRQYLLDKNYFIERLTMLLKIYTNNQTNLYKKYLQDGT